jgi:uncharacterized damage-inducible protein DinB
MDYSKNDSIQSSQLSRKMVVKVRPKREQEMDILYQAKGNTQSRKEIDTLCGLIEEAFEGDSSHSLMRNLINLGETDWTALPPGGGRTIADILEHVGWCKWMYEDYAFGSASLRGDIPPLVPDNGIRARPADELIQWIKAGQIKWLSSVRALPQDGELEQERLTNWGERMKTRTIIRIMIGHDFYHAGEINHLRSLLQGNDRWEYE